MSKKTFVEKADAELHADTLRRIARGEKPTSIPKKMKETFVSEYISNNSNKKILYEEVYTPKDNAPRFAYYKTIKDLKTEKWKEELGYVNEIVLENKTLIPIEGDEVIKKKIILADGYAHYTSEDKLFEEIKEHIHKYTYIFKDFELFSAWYVMLTWFMMILMLLII